MKPSESIKKARINAGITQAELAKRLGVTPQTVSQYERGIKNPKIETLIRFADALELDLNSLVHQSDFIEDEKGTLLVNKKLEDEVLELGKELDEINASRKSADINQLKQKLERARQIQERLDELALDAADSRLLTSFHKISREDRDKVISYCEWLAQTPPLAAPLAPDETEDDPFEHPEPVESKPED